MAELSVAAFTPPADLISAYGLTACDDVLYVPCFLEAANVIEAALQAELEWREESIVMFGRRVTVPRLCAWCGDEGVAYRYSRTVHRAGGWSSGVGTLRDELLVRLGIRFNFVLANWYRDGADAMGWHADDEPELGEHPCVASLSFGAPRRFTMRARDGKARRIALLLEPGSLLLMWGRSQHDWQHALPKTKRTVGSRINLTFRNVIPPA